MQEFIKLNQKHITIVFVIGIIVGALGLSAIKGFRNAELSETLASCQKELRGDVEEDKSKINEKSSIEIQEYIIEKATVSEIFDNEDGSYITISFQDINSEDEFSTLERKVNITQDTTFIKKIELARGDVDYISEGVSVNDLSVGINVYIRSKTDLYTNEESEAQEIRIVD